MGFEKATQIGVGNNPSADPFGRFRVSNPTTLFDSKQLGEKDDINWDTLEDGTGTSVFYDSDKSEVQMSFSTTEGATRRILRRSKRRFNYQSGKGQLIEMTGKIGASTAGEIRRIGLFDDENGLYFAHENGLPYVVIKTNTSGTPTEDQFAEQNDWNLDKMDGSGTSGVNLDFDKAQIFIVDFQYLGVGRIRFGFNVDGLTIYCHEFNNANNIDFVYMTTPNLPLSYEYNISGGITPAGEMTQICSTVITEGGRAKTGVSYGFQDNSGTNVGTQLTSLISVKLNALFLGSNVQFVDFETINTSNQTYYWQIILNPTYNTTQSYSRFSTSSLDVSTSNGTVSGGTVLKAGFGSSSNLVKSVISGILDNDFALGSFIDGTPDNICIAVARITGTGNGTYYSTINWLDTK